MGESELGYTGGLKLSGTLLHLRARVYDSGTRRFLQPDLVDLLRFAYVGGDPANFERGVEQRVESRLPPLAAL